MYPNADKYIRVMTNYAFRIQEGWVSNQILFQPPDQSISMNNTIKSNPTLCMERIIAV